MAPFHVQQDTPFPRKNKTHPQNRTPPLNIPTALNRTVCKDLWEPGPTLLVHNSILIMLIGTVNIECLNLCLDDDSIIVLRFYSILVYYY